MDPKEALKLLDRIVAQAQMSRINHSNTVEAVKTLSDFIDKNSTKTEKVG